MKINLERAKAGNLLDLGEAIWDAYQDGGDFGNAVSEVLAEKMVERYQKRIAAALRAKGFDIEDDGTLDAETLRTLLNYRMGLSIEAWNPGAVAAAVDGLVRKKLGEELGLDVPEGVEPSQIKQLLIDRAIVELESGRGSEILGAHLVQGLTAARAWDAAGVPEAERKKILSRWYQKKFRRTHKGVWTDA